MAQRCVGGTCRTSTGRFTSMTMISTTLSGKQIFRLCYPMIFNLGFTVFGLSRKISMTRSRCLFVRRSANGLPVYVSWCRPSPTRSMVTMLDLTTNLLGSTGTRRGMPTHGIRLSIHTTDVPPTIFTLIEVVFVTPVIDDHYSI